jgi:NADH:ubiquinone oxidoreductase subunit C
MNKSKGIINIYEHFQDGQRRIHWECTSYQFLAIASRLKEANAKLITIFARQNQPDEAALHYFFELNGTTCLVKTFTDKSSIGSLYTLFINADFIEREINNIFKIKFLGHPNLPRYGNGEEC